MTRTAARNLTPGQTIRIRDIDHELISVDRKPAFITVMVEYNGSPLRLGPFAPSERVNVIGA